MNFCCNHRSDLSKNNFSASTWVIPVLIGLLGLIAWRFLYTPQKAQTTPLIAIAQIAEHPSLDQVRSSFISALEKGGYEKDTTVRFIFDNAQGSTQYATEIAKKFAAVSPTLSLAIGTPMAQSLKNTLSHAEAPLLFAAVTDPVAAKLMKSSTQGDPWVAGVTDAQPVEAQLNLIHKILPGATKLGIVYHSGEVNSSTMVDRVKQEGSFIVLEKAVSKNHEIPAAINALAGKVDALYITADNLVVSCLSAYLQTASEHKIPVFSADPDLVKRGVLASVGVSYSAVGTLAGELAVKILNHEIEVEAIGVQSPQALELATNSQAAAQLGITFPQDLRQDAKSN